MGFYFKGRVGIEYLFLFVVKEKVCFKDFFNVFYFKVEFWEFFFEFFVECEYIFLEFVKEFMNGFYVKFFFYVFIKNKGRKVV